MKQVAQLDEVIDTTVVEVVTAKIQLLQVDELDEGWHTFVAKVVAFCIATPSTEVEYFQLVHALELLDLLDCQAAVTQLQMRQHPSRSQLVEDGRPIYVAPEVHADALHHRQRPNVLVELLYVAQADFPVSKLPYLLLFFHHQLALFSLSVTQDSLSEVVEDDCQAAYGLLGGYCYVVRCLLDHYVVLLPVHQSVHVLPFPAVHTDGGCLPVEVAAWETHHSLEFVEAPMAILQNDSRLLKTAFDVGDKSTLFF